MALAAGHNLTIGTADNTHSEDHSLKVNTYGAQRSGLHGMFGVAKAKQTASETDTTPTGSLIGSTDGAVTLSAGQDVHITGSDVLSQTGTAIVGQNVTIDAAVGTADSHQTQSLHTGGIMAGLTGGAASSAINGGVANSLRPAIVAKTTVRVSSSRRMKIDRHLCLE